MSENDKTDADLPGDEDFRPLPPVVEVAIPMMCPQCVPGQRCPVCGGPRAALGMAMTISPESQAALHHNRLRYVELQLLRMGQANRYKESRYR